LARDASPRPIYGSRQRKLQQRPHAGQIEYQGDVPALDIVILNRREPTSGEVLKSACWPLADRP